MRITPIRAIASLPRYTQRQHDEGKNYGKAYCGHAQGMARSNPPKAHAASTPNLRKGELSI